MRGGERAWRVMAGRRKVRRRVVGSECMGCVEKMSRLWLTMMMSTTEYLEVWEFRGEKRMGMRYEA